MQHYLLSVMQPEGERPAPEVLAGIQRAIEGYHQELKDAGAWVFAGGLHSPGTSTVVRLKGDEVLTTDGPYAETKEYLGGICIVRAPDLDAALAWGRKAARATTLPIEVRPFYGEVEN
ncbi:YciI family protein [Streptomyces sp. NPDC051320]|uniref:YciI family protein n=1 Tax=Streptomyces sp. NPDC051320 TaxID=3154644 RepID=UPI00343B030E